MVGKEENKKSSQNEKSDAIERQLKIGKAKENLTISVIQCNRLLNNMQKQLADCYKKYNAISQGFKNQSELVARCNMVLRLLTSCTKMLGQQKMQLWMINEDEIERKVDAER